MNWNKLLLAGLALLLSFNLSSCGGSGGGGVLPESNLWTWVSGSDERNQSDAYGEKSTADADNIPGAREASVSWIDYAGNFWLFGGLGYDSDRNYGRLNDLWRYATDRR
jgi:hypothetical protein